MKNNITENIKSNLKAVRESYSGRLLTNPQFSEAIAITAIMEREIAKSGRFKDKLGDYAYAMARSERIDVAQAERTIRDLFKARTGRTMNQVREALDKRDEQVSEDARDKAYRYAVGVSDLIEQGMKISFHRAFAAQAEALARKLGITDFAAMKLMREVFEETEEGTLYDWGKELEQQFYRPQIDAEKRERQHAGQTEMPEPVQRRRSPQKQTPRP